MLPYLHLIRCPACGGPLAQNSQELSCQACRRGFPLENGIPRLYHPHHSAESPQDVTDRIRTFYEDHPFPDYDDFDDLAALMDKARQGLFARLLDQDIPFGARVLECGCGTGQLSCYLGIAHRTVFGTDLSLSSLRLAEDFRRRHQLDRVHFLQMNLFRPIFEENSFDLVICNGVLHHTSDPSGGFAGLASLVKPGGHLVVGLYHRYGRLGTDLRRLVFRLSGDRWARLDPRLRRRKLNQARRKAWFEDQYRNPHEVKYTIGQVRKWLDPNRLDLVKTLPKTRLGSRLEENENIFESEAEGGAVSRSLTEWSQMFRGADEGGFFTVIARRRQAS